jgi:hypothetical protein
MHDTDMLETDTYAGFFPTRPAKRQNCDSGDLTIDAIVIAPDIA